MNTKYIVLLLSLIFFIQSCHQNRISDSQAQIADLVIFYTNDEHGWMEKTDDTDGASGLAGLWKANENYTPDGPFMILSGGDMWTGPAISTWFKGESMVEVMNALNYDAAAVGNHEFDFKIEGLRANIERSDFPLLSANLREKSSGNIPDFVQPYMIKEVNGVQVGVIGLSNLSTPLTTFPAYVADYDFIAYQTALEEFVPQMKDDGAELLIIAGHICYSEIVKLVPAAKNLGISIIGGGHCHETISKVIDGVAVIVSGSKLRNYVRLEVSYDLETDKVTRLQPVLVRNENSQPDSEVMVVVSKWQEQLGNQLSHVIGYADPSIGQNSQGMHNMVTDSWLVTFPQADVSITNTGGIRQSIPVGEISLETIVGLLPFDNTILELDMPGSDLIDVLTISGGESLIFAGMTLKNGIRFSDGSKVHQDSVYQIVTTDYLYSRPDYSFQTVDPEPYSTSVHYRQPVIDWIQSLNTTSAQPLNQYLDNEKRK